MPHLPTLGLVCALVLLGTGLLPGLDARAEDAPAVEPLAQQVGEPLPADFYGRAQRPETVPLRFAAEWTHLIVSAFEAHQDAAEAAAPGTGATPAQRELLAKLATEAGAWAALRHHSSRPLGRDAPDFAPLADAARIAVDAGFDDPVFDTLAKLARNTRHNPLFWLGRRGSEGADAAGYAPEVGLLLRDIAMQATRGESRYPGWRQFETMRRDGYRALLAVLDRPEALSPGEAVLLPGMITGLAHDAPAEVGAAFLDALADRPDAPRAAGRAWLAALARGSLAIEAGWSIRGGGWAHEVNDAAWPLFHQHLELAAAALADAMERRPSDPTAATEAIVAATGGGGGDPEALQRRASSIDPWSRHPWWRLTWANYPRWGGSFEAMLEVGLRSLRESPPESLASWELEVVLRRILTDGQAGDRGVDFLLDTRSRWRKPVLQLIARVDGDPQDLSPLVDAATKRRELASLVFAVSHSAGQLAATAALLDVLDVDAPDTDHAALASMHLFGVDKRWDPGAVRAATVPEAAEALRAAAAGSLSPQELLAAAETLPDARAARHLRDAAIAMRHQRAWDRGEAVDLLAEGLAGWRVSRGDARLAEEGVELHYVTGGGGGSRLVHTLEPGTRWECRFTIEASPAWSEATSWGTAGLILVDNEARQSHRSPMIGVSTRGRTDLRLSEDAHREDINRTRPGESQPGAQLPRWPTGTFVVRRIGDRVNVWRDGLQVATDALVGQRPGADVDRLGVGVWTEVPTPASTPDAWDARLLRFEARPLAADASLHAAADSESWVHELRPSPAGSDAGDHASPDAAPPTLGEASALPLQRPLPEGSGPVDPGRPLREVAALFRDAWTDSLAESGEANAAWADDARTLFANEAARVAAAFHPELPRPSNFHPRDRDSALAKRLLAGEAALDPLVVSLAKAVQTPATHFGRRGGEQRNRARHLVAAGHTPLAASLLRIRSWTEETYERAGGNPGSRLRGARGARNGLVLALAENADWLNAHPDHARALGTLVQPFADIANPVHAHLLREALRPAIESGGAAGRAARRMLAAQDRAVADAIEASVRAAGDQAWTPVLTTAARFRDRARAHLIAIAEDAEAPAADRAAAMNALVALRLEDRDLTDDPDLDPVATSALAWARAAALAAPDRAAEQTAWARGLAGRHPQTQAGRLASQDARLASLAAPSRVVDGHPGLLVDLLDQVRAAFGNNATPEDRELAAARRAWALAHADELAALSERAAVAAEAHPRRYPGPEVVRGTAVGLLRWANRDDLAAALAAGANRPGPLPGEGHLGPMEQALADPAASAARIARWQAAFDAGLPVDLLADGLTGWWPYRGAWTAEPGPHGPALRDHPRGGRFGLIQCPIDLGPHHRILVTFDQHTSTPVNLAGRGRTGLLLGTPTKPDQIGVGHWTWPEVALTTNRRLVRRDSPEPGAALSFDFRPDHTLVADVDWSSDRLSFEVERHGNLIDVAVNGTPLLKDDPVVSGLPRGGFTISHQTSHGQDHHPIRVIRAEVQKLDPR